MVGRRKKLLRGKSYLLSGALGGAALRPWRTAFHGHEEGMVEGWRGTQALGHSNLAVQPQS